MITESKVIEYRWKNRTKPAWAALQAANGELNIAGKIEQNQPASMAYFGIVN